MHLVRLLIRTFALLLLAVFGTGLAFAAQGDWSQVSYPIVAQELDVQCLDLTNTARAPPTISANVTSTGNAFAQGEERASDCTVIRVAALTFDGGFIAPNRVGFDTSNVESKLKGYLLDPAHPQNQSKADWFSQALGFNQSNWQDLASQLDISKNLAIGGAK